MSPASVRARLSEFAVAATVSAGMALATTGCGGADQPKPAAKQATAPARGFSEDVPADATVPVTEDLQQALAELQAALKDAATTSRTATQDAEVAKLQAQADKIRSDANYALSAGLISGMLQTATSLSVQGVPIPKSTLSDFNKAVTDDLAKKDSGTATTSTVSKPTLKEQPTTPTAP